MSIPRPEVPSTRDDRSGALPVLRQQRHQVSPYCTDSCFHHLSHISLDTDSYVLAFSMQMPISAAHEFTVVCAAVAKAFNRLSASPLQIDSSTQTDVATPGVQNSCFLVPRKAFFHPHVDLGHLCRKRCGGAPDRL